MKPTPGNCTYGAKQPLYWFQKERNNVRSPILVKSWKRRYLRSFNAPDVRGYLRSTLLLRPLQLQKWVPRRYLPGFLHLHSHPRPKPERGTHPDQSHCSAIICRPEFRWEDGEGIERSGLFVDGLVPHHGFVCQRYTLITSDFPHLLESFTGPCALIYSLMYCVSVHYTRAAMDSVYIDVTFLLSSCACINYLFDNTVPVFYICVLRMRSTWLSLIKSSSPQQD